jgi:cellulose biosynthesis protein BcsQ
MARARVAVFARKGGAGKTALTTLLARELVRQGLRVLVVDLDPQVVSVSTAFGIHDGGPAPVLQRARGRGGAARRAARP